VEGAGGHSEDEPLDELGLGGGLSDSSSGPPEGPPPPDLAGGSVGGETWSAPWRSFGGTLAPPPAPPSPAPTDSDADGWTLIGGQAAAEETEADPPHPHPVYLITPILDTSYNSDYLSHVSRPTHTPLPCCVPARGRG